MSTENMLFTADEIAKQNIEKEDLIISISERKQIKVIILKEPLNGSRIALQIVLVFNDKPTRCSVLLALDEFEKFAETVKTIWETPNAEKKEFSNKREWQLYNHHLYKGIWNLDLRDNNGIQSKIGLTLYELRSIALSSVFMIKRCKEMNI